jgi:hypothetical protein
MRSAPVEVKRTSIGQYHRVMVMSNANIKEYKALLKEANEMFSWQRSERIISKMPH